MDEAADYINQPHEDYPERVDDTFDTIDLTRLDDRVVREFNIRLIHEYIFTDHGEGAGNWRKVNVIVGLHRPPNSELMPKLMDEFFWHYRYPINTIEELQDMYWDFETIHPFVDGNGRVGGVLLAVISNLLHPEKGYMVGDPNG
tara:strand:+ start:5266 stop:5697 length:432 start_codon:yes stop_codon:yes gene_type:complete